MLFRSAQEKWYDHEAEPQCEAAAAQHEAVETAVEGVEQETGEDKRKRQPVVYALTSDVCNCGDDECHDKYDANEEFHDSPESLA